MTNESVEYCNKVLNHIRESQFSDKQRVYPVISKSLEKTKDFYLRWLEIHAEYAEALGNLNVSFAATNQANRLVSLWVTARETSFRNILSGRIPPEAYLLVSSFYKIFNVESDFVLEEGDEFHSSDLNDEIERELARLPAPPPVKSRIETLKRILSQTKVRKIYYDTTEYGSPLSWLILLHEAAHQIYDDEAIRSLNPYPTEITIEEMIVDLVVCSVFGPAYAVALTRYHRKWPGGAGHSHPKEPARIYGLLKCVQGIVDKTKEIEGSFLTKIKESQDYVAYRWREMKDEATEEQKNIESIYDKLAEAISTYLNRNRIKSFDQFALAYGETLKPYDPDLNKILNMLQNGIPVAADPRIIYNSIASQENLNPMLVSESLKKWVVLSKWRSLNG